MNFTQYEIKTVTAPCPIRMVGDGNQHHFFGYYNKNIWDPSGRYLLANRSDHMTGDLHPNLAVQVGMFDLENDDEFIPFHDTTTWNWQMGCQLQWLDRLPGRKVVFNARSPEESPCGTNFQSIVYDVDARTMKTLPLPVYVVAPNNDYALCINYSRLQVTHPTIGYHATNTEPKVEKCSDKDGIFRMNFTTGEYELILSIQDLYEFQHVPSMENAIHWVTHLEINPASSRILFIHRWTERIEDETCFLHRLYTVNPDGSDLYLLECSDHPLPQLDANYDPSQTGVFDYEKSEYQISHPTWRDDTHVMVWGPHREQIAYHLYKDRTPDVSAIGAGILTENGHMTYSPDKKWILTDTYPDAETNLRDLILYNVADQRSFVIGKFGAGPDLGKVNRCDLHPRWNREGTEVCIDSVHEEQRQLYIIDVSALTGR